MKLASYDIKVTLSDPSEPETQISTTIRNVPRDKVLTTPIPLRGLLEMFEESVD